MKKLVLILAIFSFLIGGCTQDRTGKGTEKKTPEQTAKEKAASLEEDLNSLDRDKIELLALKYSVPREDIRGMLKDYLQRHDPLYRESDNIDFQETFTSIKEKYKVQPEKIGAILIDYKIMREAETGE